nr:wall-associated receptor kinase-like 1 [Ipomoea batatas]
MVEMKDEASRCVLQKPLDPLLRVHMPVLLEFLPHLGARLPEHHCVAGEAELEELTENDLPPPPPTFRFPLLSLAGSGGDAVTGKARLRRVVRKRLNSVPFRNRSNPPKPYLNSFLQIEFQGQIVAVSLQDQTITTLKSVANFCDNSADRNAIITNGTDLSGSPFYYSKSRNKFLFGGCGNSLLTQNSAVLAGCTAVCSANITGFSGCYGYDCLRNSRPLRSQLLHREFHEFGNRQP